MQLPGGLMRVSKEILTLIPYKPGKPISEAQREYGLEHVTKLASNENPLGVSPHVIESLQKHLEDIHRYPDPSCYDLSKKISELWNVPKEKIAFGNGSNELIDLLIRIFCEPQEAILTMDKAFVAYQVCAQAGRVKSYFCDLNADFDVDLDQMASMVESDPKIRLVFLPNPNNPTGRILPQKKVKAFLSRLSSRPDLLIVFDEAYHEFVRHPEYQSAIHYLDQFPQVVVLRTFSKTYGLAGLRLGVMFASAEVIGLVHRVRNPFNVNSLVQVAGIAALEDFQHIQKSQQIVWQGLDYFYQQLKAMNIPYVESQGNFVLVDCQRSALEVNEYCLRHGIILRPVTNYGLPHHLRISVGLPEENEKSMKVLAQALGK
jgi:histidinol-phosphate aminotransferase